MIKKADEARGGAVDIDVCQEDDPKLHLPESTRLSSLKTTWKVT